MTTVTTAAATTVSIPDNQYPLCWARRRDAVTAVMMAYP